MKHNILKNPAFTTVCALFCCALWGISTPIVKMGYAFTDAGHIPSLLLWAGIQFVIAGIFSLAFCGILEKRFPTPKKKSVKGILLVSLFQTILQYSLLYIGLMHTSSVKGAILKSTDVFFIVLLAALVFKTETLSLKKVICCILGFSGIIIMNLNGLSFNISPLGDGLVVLSVISYSLSVILTKKFAEDEDPLVLCGFQMLLGGAVLALSGAVFGGKFDLGGLLPIILILSAIYAVSYCLWTVLLKHNPASRVSINSFSTPLFGVIFSAFLLTEKGGVALPNLVVSLVLVCFGILLWGYEKKTK